MLSDLLFPISTALANINLQHVFFNVLDIICVTVLLYFLLQRFQKSQAIPVIIGIITLKIVHFLSYSTGLYTVYWLLNHVFEHIFIFIFIIFQADIRKALVDIGTIIIKLPTRTSYLTDDHVNEIIDACLTMAERRVGALIVFERNTNLIDLIEREGQKIDAQISSRLLMNIFYHGAPLHDGAVVIIHGRIAAAGCILPLAVAKGKNFGTRHRAALGITQDSDAAVLVVSEERGEVSLAHRGKLTILAERSELEKVLHEIL